MWHPARMPLDLDRFSVLTFDCYGTLIDWETGILQALRPLLPDAARTPTDEELLASFAVHEAEVEARPYRPYREVLAEVARAIVSERGGSADEAQLRGFGGSVADWPPFPDSVDALSRLATRFRLGVLTNCDDDLFGVSARRLGTTFDPVVTAQQVGAYKPAIRGFEVLLDRVGVPPDRVLHVAQSLFHDHVPAKSIGLATVWVDRRAGRPGGGATPPAEAVPDLTVPDLATLAAFVVEDAAAG